ncbi:MAG: FAD-dependent oxidoreductase [Saprospiraceae bacterium]|nr:FAD-dependent oxidoreductase [Saprospiraceae bacterium]
MPPAIWYPIQLHQIIDESANTKRFLFKIETPDIFDFQAGQFLTCDLPIGEKRAQRWRSYSIANRNTHQNEIEFCISYKEGGLASDYFFNKIKIADTFKVKGPEGNFILPENKDLNLFLICTGTGLAPFRSMLQEIEFAKNYFRSVHIIYGTRNIKDLIYTDDLINWLENIPEFYCHICLSRELDPTKIKHDKLNFHSGYVHEVYKQILKEKSYPTESMQFMICGWSAMIDQAVVTLFSELNYSREQIRFELYG